MLSERSAPFVEEPDAWSSALAARRARGELLIDLTLEHPARAPSLPDDDDAIRAAFAAARPPHAPAPRGALAAREALVARGFARHPDRVLIGPTPSASFAHLFSVLADPGDELLVPAPLRGALAHAAHLAGVALVPYAVRYDDERWTFDAAELFEAISSRTRALVAASPGVPAGSHLDADALDALASFELPLIVDERLFDCSIAPAHDRAGAREDGPLVVSLGDASAHLAIDGLALGWLTLGGDARAGEQLAARLEHVLVDHPSPSITQDALPALLALDARRRAVGERLAENHARVRETLGALAARAEGGVFATVRLDPDRSAEALARSLLEAGLAVPPCSRWELAEGEPWLALSLLAAPADVTRAAAAIAERSTTTPPPTQTSSSSGAGGGRIAA
ncbi:MAG: aminotransferase class I/II-fold pyridoxal phosphate-dependent enzyme [Sandaracinaceae bacterium]|nr:aminotransferase class I/II-fold pyridoxal phosphate-dependent enzyme [Sandaracinaceae bacterium]